LALDTEKRRLIFFSESAIFRILKALNMGELKNRPPEFPGFSPVLDNVIFLNENDRFLKN